MDKSSYTELSEAVTSMFAWYRDATVCYAYLADVPPSEDPHHSESAFRHSRWFRRGWTLQELIAPPVVIFLSRDWKVIGSKESLVNLIKDITRIDQDILLHRKSVDEASVADRMSWAALRETTRIEDEVYCLLGLFGVVMTPRYGDGVEEIKRFRGELLRYNRSITISALDPHWIHSRGRGQDEESDIEHIHWQQIITVLTEKRLSWIRKIPHSPHHLTLLAPSPRAFLFSGNIRPVSLHNFCDRLVACGASDDQLQHYHLHKVYNPSPYGIRTRFCVITLPSQQDMEVDTQLEWYLVILACERYIPTKTRHHLLARVCYALPSESSSKILHVGEPCKGWMYLLDTHFPAQYKSTLRLGPPIPEDICIPHSTFAPRPIRTVQRPFYINSCAIKITVGRWIKAMLNLWGYHCVDLDGSIHLQTSDILLGYSSIPLILRLKSRENGDEAAIFLRVYIPSYSSERWFPYFDSGDLDEHTGTLSCLIVTSFDPHFHEVTTSTCPLSYFDQWRHERRNQQDDASTSQGSDLDTGRDSEFRVRDGVSLRPVLIPIGPDHYDLRIDAVYDNTPE